MIERSHFGGYAIAPDHHDIKAQAAARLVTLVRESVVTRTEQRETARQVYLIFDVDGVLVTHEETMESLVDYLEDRSTLVQTFQAEIREARAHGFKIGLCTGRSGEFARLLANRLFKDTYPDVIISESGLVIEEAGDERTAASVSIDDVARFESRQQTIIEYFRALGWEYWPLPHSLALRWPSDWSRQDAVDEVDRYLTQLGIRDSVTIVGGAQSVDVSPRGASKQAALAEVLGADTHMIYFGDSPGDHEAMERAAIVFVPQNAYEVTKAHAAGLTAPDHAAVTTLAVQMQRPLLGGTTDALYQINGIVGFLKNQD